MIRFAIVLSDGDVVFVSFPKMLGDEVQMRREIVHFCMDNGYVVDAIERVAVSESERE